MTGWLRHRLFAPVLALLALGWGTLIIALLVVGPDLGGWTRALLTYCFGWNAATRAYRLDAVLLVVLEPPLFALVLGLFYADELRAFLRGAGARVVSAAAALGFVAAAVALLTTGSIVSGAPPVAGAVVREGRPAPRADLVDHRGRPFDPGQPRQRPVALTFVYADCHATCPVLVATLKSAAASAGERALFVTVTLDPEHDTPSRLAEYAERWGLGDGWHLLTGSRREVDALRAAYHVQAERLAGGEIAHENVVIVLDRAGRVAYTHRGLSLRPEDLAAELRRLGAEAT